MRRHNHMQVKDFQQIKKPKSKLPDATLQQTYCCGIKDLHNIQLYTDAKECLVHTLSHVFDVPTDIERQRAADYFKTNANYKYDERKSWAMVNSYIKLTINRPAHFVFSETSAFAIGEGMLKTIAEYKLGTCVKTESAYNVNSGNSVKAFVWTPHWDVCEKFFKEAKYRRPTLRWHDDMTGTVLDFPEPEQKAA